MRSAAPTHHTRPFFRLDRKHASTRPSGLCTTGEFIRKIFRHVTPRFTSVVFLYLFMLLTLHDAGAENKTDTPVNNGLSQITAGIYTFEAPELRMKKCRVQFPDVELRDYVIDERFDGEWTLNVSLHWEKHDLYRLRVEGTDTAVRRVVDFLIRPQERENGTVLRPVLATEKVQAMDRDMQLLSNQTLEVAITPPGDREKQPVDMETAALWAAENTDRIHKQDVVVRCADYFWHNQGIEKEPGSYNGVITLMYRQLELDPQLVQPYCSIAWLLWSKWVTWKTDPEKEKGAKDGVERAIRLLHQGSAANPDNAHYQFEAAATIMPLARHHKPELYDLILQYLKRSESLAEEPEFQARARKVLGHCYRQLDKTDKAIHWYQRVLDIEPKHKIAAKYIKQLQEKKGNTNGGDNP